MISAIDTGCSEVLGNAAMLSNTHRCSMLLVRPCHLMEFLHVKRSRHGKTDIASYPQARNYRSCGGRGNSPPMWVWIEMSRADGERAGCGGILGRCTLLGATSRRKGTSLAALGRCLGARAGRPARLSYAAHHVSRSSSDITGPSLCHPSWRCYLSQRALRPYDIGDRSPLFP